MAYTNHGGGCCGYKHIHTLDRMSVETFDRHLEEHFSPDNMNRVVEVILSERQVQTPPDPTDSRFHRSVVEAGGWPVVLAARGFVLSAVWNNSNSRNNCYQFLKTTEFLLNTPVWWTREHRILRPAPEVHLDEADVVVGDYVRDRENPRDVMRVESLNNDGTILRTWNVFTNRRRDYTRLAVEKISLTRGTRGIYPPPARVDVNLPVEIVNGAGESSPAVIVRHNQRAVVARALNPLRSNTTNLSVEWTYEISSGALFGQDNQNIARLRNVRPLPTVDIDDILATARRGDPVVVLTEYFAAFRDGRRLGPFPTPEAVHEAYPRVLSFATRRIFSDGNTTEEVRAFRG